MLLAACTAAPKSAAPRWLVARSEVVASDDASVKLRHGYGVQIVEERGGAGRSSEGHWFPLTQLEPASTFAGSAGTTPTPTTRPAEVAAGERWIDVDIAAQRLLACEGDRVVRALRISTGVGEEGAPYSTPRGSHRIYAKLRSAIMASTPPVPGAPPDPHPYRFEGVPSVQYFYKEIALHGAYWHRRFGERISHGCVNLAPDDAAWLFDFTEPQLRPSERERAIPEGGKGGTLVRVR